MQPALTPQQINVLRATQMGNNAANSFMSQELDLDRDMMSMLGPYLKSGHLRDPTAFVPPSFMKYAGGWRSNPAIASFMRSIMSDRA